MFEGKHLKVGQQLAMTLPFVTNVLVSSPKPHIYLQLAVGLCDQ